LPTEPLSAFHAGDDALLIGPADAPLLRVAEKPFAALWEVGFLSDPVAEAMSDLAGEGWRLLRLAPRRVWLVSEVDQPPPAVSAADTVLIDLSHGRVRVAVEGSAVGSVMARLVPIDLRVKSCPVGAVASTLMHHVGVTVERRDTAGFDLFLPRSFARALTHEIHAAARSATNG